MSPTKSRPSWGSSFANRDDRRDRLVFLRISQTSAPRSCPSLAIRPLLPSRDHRFYQIFTGVLLTSGLKISLLGIGTIASLRHPMPLSSLSHSCRWKWLYASVQRLSLSRPCRDQNGQTGEKRDLKTASQNTPQDRRAFYKRSCGCSGCAYLEGLTFRTSELTSCTVMRYPPISKQKDFGVCHLIMPIFCCSLGILRRSRSDGKYTLRAHSIP